MSSDDLASIANSKALEHVEIVLSKERRCQSWQSWTKEGRKRWVDRFIKEKESTTSSTSGNAVLQQPVRVNSILDSDEEELRTLDGADDAEEVDDEELDAIVSSWKRNYTYFQREQALRATEAANSLNDEEEDSILHAILEEDATAYGEEEDDDDDTASNMDEATTYTVGTTYTVATHEEADFREFVRRQEQEQREKPFMERFLEALGMRDDDDDDASVFSSNETVYTTGTRAILPPVQEEDDDDEPSTPPAAETTNVTTTIRSANLVARGGDSQREAAAIEMPLDAPTIPSFDSLETITPKDAELRHSAFARMIKGYKKKNKKDDVSVAFSGISHTMTM